MAWNKFEKLSGADKPFVLTMLTVDTHPPYGTKSKSCDTYSASENPMLISVNCSDQLASELSTCIRVVVVVFYC